MALKLIARMDIPGIGNIQVKSDIRNISRRLSRMSKVGLPRAITRATNKSLLKTRTQARKALAKKFNLPAKEFSKSVTHRNATRNSGVAYIQGRGPQIPIYRTKGSKTQKRLGVSINTGTGRRIIKHSFIATVGTHTGVFKRTRGVAVRRVRFVTTTGQRQTKALPIRELKFPSPAHMITKASNANKLFTFFTNDYPIQLRRQLNAEFDKARGVGS